MQGSSTFLAALLLCSSALSSSAFSLSALGPSALSPSSLRPSAITSAAGTSRPSSAPWPRSWGLESKPKPKARSLLSAPRLLSPSAPQPLSPSTLGPKTCTHQLRAKEVGAKALRAQDPKAQDPGGKDLKAQELRTEDLGAEELRAKDLGVDELKGEVDRSRGEGVCVVGSLNYDQTVYVRTHPSPGQTVYGSKYLTGFGGKGANQCVMAALMGAKTSMVGALGDDDNAKITLENMKAKGVNVEGIRAKSEARSGVAQITVSEDGQNIIVVVPGANLLLDSEDLASSAQAIKGARVLLCQNEINPKITLEAMRLAKSSAEGPLVILNAAPAPSQGLNWQEGEWEDIQDMLSACDILCVNESEAKALSGVEINCEDPENLEKSAVKAAQILFEKKCSRILMTLGPHGSCLLDKSEAGSPPSFFHVKGGPPVKAVDTAGAGDAYLGALAAFLASGSSVSQAMTGAGRLASLSVQRPGAQSSFPHASELDQSSFPLA